MSRLETNGYYALGVPLYLALAALEFYFTRRKGLRVYRFADTIGNLSGGLGEVVIGLFLGPLLIALYDIGYEHLALWRWPEGSLVPWALAFLAGDLCYYLYHRAGHRVALLWAIHGVHHQSEEFNLSIALRHPWFSDVYSFVFYIPLPLLGVPPPHFFIAITLISFYALSVHSRIFNRPSFFFLVTPRTHILHHATNPGYIGKNLGAMFTLWDRLFGTHVEPDPAEPPRLGTRRGYRTHDGARAQWIFFEDLLLAARQARSLRDKLRILFGPPGWLPEGVRLERPEPARPDEAIPGAIKAYAALQFSLIVTTALWILWLRDQHPRWLLLAGSALILWGLSTIGRLLDGRPGAARRELLRLGAAALLGLCLAGSAGYGAEGAGLTAAALLSAAWLGSRRS